MASDEFFPQRAAPASPERIQAEQKRAANDLSQFNGQFSMRMAVERLHCIASRMIDSDSFLASLQHGIVICRSTGEEIGQIVNWLGSCLAERDRPVDHEWLMATTGYCVECGNRAIRAWRTRQSPTGFGWSLCGEEDDDGYERVYTLENRGHWLDLVSGVKGAGR